MARIYVGTSGFSYGFWHDSFYPLGVSKSKALEYYCDVFNMVEINGTFYRTPQDPTWIRWRRLANRPTPFQYAIKANRYFTHMRRLRADEDFVTRWKDFYRKCTLLGEHLGPVIFQLPPSVVFVEESRNANEVDEERLIQLGEALRRASPNGRFAFEFRHSSFYRPAVYGVCKRYDWCFATIHVANDSGWSGDLEDGFHPQKPVETASWGVYWRFHGATGQYVGNYGAELPLVISKWIPSDPGKTVYVAFNNTDDKAEDGLPSAVSDALLLRDAPLFKKTAHDARLAEMEFIQD